MPDPTCASTHGQRQVAKTSHSLTMHISPHLVFVASAKHLDSDNRHRILPGSGVMTCEEIVFENKSFPYLVLVSMLVIKLTTAHAPPGLSCSKTAKTLTMYMPSHLH